MYCSSMETMVTRTSFRASLMRNCLSCYTIVSRMDQSGRMRRRGRRVGFLLVPAVAQMTLNSVTDISFVHSTRFCVLWKPQGNTVEVYELGALARGLDTQKKFAEGAFTIYSGATQRPEGYHDPEVSSYLEEHFVHHQAEQVRKLAGYTSDLKRLLSANKQASLSLFLFDEYLQKVI